MLNVLHDLTLLSEWRHREQHIFDVAAVQMRVHGTGLDGQQRMIAVAGIENPRHPLPRNGASLRRNDNESVAIAPSKLIGYDSDLANITSLNNQYISGLENGLPVLIAPLLRHKVRDIKLNLIALDMERLKVAHALLNQDVSGWPNITVCDLGAHGGNGANLPMLRHLPQPLHAGVFHLHVGI
ncbi:hypothetical protein D3C84_807490 [compost metagenome]